MNKELLKDRKDKGGRTMVNEGVWDWGGKRRSQGQQSHAGPGKAVGNFGFLSSICNLAPTFHSASFTHGHANSNIYDVIHLYEEEMPKVKPNSWVGI